MYVQRHSLSLLLTPIAKYMKKYLIFELHKVSSTICFHNHTYIIWVCSSESMISPHGRSCNSQTIIVRGMASITLGVWRGRMVEIPGNTIEPSKSASFAKSHVYSWAGQTSSYYCVHWSYSLIPPPPHSRSYTPPTGGTARRGRLANYMSPIFKQHCVILFSFLSPSLWLSNFYVVSLYQCKKETRMVSVIFKAWVVAQMAIKVRKV